MELTSEKLDFYIKHNYNILLQGLHGCGKTARIIEALQKHNINYLYFSAPTMDPWVDFIGVPKEKTVDGLTYLDLVRPEAFAKDTVEAIVFDEFNRAPKKVKNAIMELLQFKSINGKKFNNLRFIWAAINPPDDEGSYDVDKLDLAQADRFHIILDVSNEPSFEYLAKRYGEENAKSTIEWWNQINKSKKPEEKQVYISPRRLDYALDVFTNGGDLLDVLPTECNPLMLKNLLSVGSIDKYIDKCLNIEDESKKGIQVRKILNSEFTYSRAMNYFLKEVNYDSFIKLYPFIDTETLSKIVNDNNYSLLIKNFVYSLTDSDQLSLVSNILNVPNIPTAYRKTIQEHISKFNIKQTSKVHYTGNLLFEYNLGNVDCEQIHWNNLCSSIRNCHPPFIIELTRAIRCLSEIINYIVANSKQTIKKEYPNLHVLINNCLLSLAISDKLDAIPKILLNKEIFLTLNSKLDNKIMLSIG